MVLSVPLAARIAALPPAVAPAASPGDTLPPAARAAVLDALDRGETHYTDRPGVPELRARIAARLTARFGLTVKGGSDVVVTCGVEEARFVALQELAKPGSIVFAVGNAAERVAGAAAIRGAGVVPTPVPEAVLAFLPASAGEPALRAALDQIGPDTVVVFEDDAGPGFHPAAVADFAARTVTIGDLVAPGLAGARVGFLAAPTLRAPALRDFKQALTICTTNLSQWAALAAMGEP